MDNADSIEFNMDGVDRAKFAEWLKDPIVGPPGTYTNAELYRILKNPELLEKTIFSNGDPPTDWLP